MTHSQAAPGDPAHATVIQVANFCFGQHTRVSHAAQDAKIGGMKAESVLAATMADLACKLAACGS
jgi:hypothetical protein